MPSVFHSWLCTDVWACVCYLTPAWIWIDVDLAVATVLALDITRGDLASDMVHREVLAALLPQPHSALWWAEKHAEEAEAPVNQRTPPEHKDKLQVSRTMQLPSHSQALISQRISVLAWKMNHLSLGHLHWSSKLLKYDAHHNLLVD